MNFPQVAMFHIMPALSLHRQGEWGWSIKYGKAWTGRGGSQKFPNLCGHSSWMTPKTNICGKLGVWSNLVKSFEKFANENVAIFSKVVAN